MDNPTRAESRKDRRQNLPIRKLRHPAARSISQTGKGILDISRLELPLNYRTSEMIAATIERQTSKLDFDKWDNAIFCPTGSNSARQKLSSPNFQIVLT